METKSSSKRKSPVLSKNKKLEFGSGLWVSLMMKMKEFRARPRQGAGDVREAGYPGVLTVN